MSARLRDARRPGVGLLLVATLALAAASTPARAQEATLLPAVKAAFVYNFIKLVSWPDRRFARPDSPLEVCVLPGEAMLAPLQQALGGKTVEGRAIRVASPDSAEDRSQCHVLYLGAAFEARYRSLMAGLGANGVLLVDEGRSFSWPDGMIRLFVDEQRIRFELNLLAVERAGLKIDPRLIRLARIAVP